MKLMVSYSSQLNVLQVPLSLQLAASVVADLLISVPLVYYLWANRTGLEKTDNIINKLIVWTVETTLLTGCAPLIYSGPLFRQPAL